MAPELRVEDATLELHRRRRGAVERRLDVPALHDEQHGTAVAVLPGPATPARVSGRDLSESHVMSVGAGAGGAATAERCARSGWTGPAAR
jgi:malate dehydrogenase (oxaloacetate-decarboxylating)